MENPRGFERGYRAGGGPHRALRPSAAPGRELAQLCTLAGAEYKAARVRVRALRWAEELDVVHLRRDTRVQNLADFPCEFGELFNVADVQVLPVFLDEKKPVAAP